ncbi:GNAT family N-acetyltransferase [Nocardioides zhouii]|uniref:GNAT family N-acetyltransferase n=1 Tax=Nocardioides zhouii TaxID=1168729 RepID=UPI001F5E1C86|nr:GNAT family N-acetyltransferase [Nocardioides zhouii]
MRTERLLLRPYAAADAPRVLDTLGRSEVIRWLGNPPPAPMADLDEALDWIDVRRQREAADQFDVTRAIVVRDTGVVAGKVSLARAHRLDTGLFMGEYEVGWWLHPDSAGHGYATEAARALIDDVFERGLAEVWCGMYVDNDASAHVAERLGLPFLGVQQDPWYEGDSRLYRVTRDEWLVR